MPHQVTLFRSFLLSSALCLTACGDPAAPTGAATATPPPSTSVTTSVDAEAESQRLNAWFDVKNEERLGFNPLELTSLGRKELYDRVGDYSEAGLDRYLDWFGATVEELKRDFNYDALDFEAQTSYDLWIYTYDTALANNRFRRQEYVLNQMFGAHTSLPTALISLHAVDTPDDLRAYISRVEAIGVAIKQVLTRVQMNVESGVRAPRFSYESVIEESGKLLQGRPFDAAASEDAPLFSDAKTKLAALQQEGLLDADEVAVFEADVERALLDYFAPAYRELIAWFEADLANAPTDTLGATELPDGAAYYEQALRDSTTLPLTADAVHATGLAEVERIRGAMQALKDSLGFDGDLAAFNNFLATDDRFFYPNTDDGRQGYLDDATSYIDRMRDLLPQYFGILPKAPLVVRRVEPFREQDGAAQHYMSGSVDGSRPGIYYVHLSDTLAMPKTEMEAVAYHEGLPGHHMQISIAQELTGLPAFRGQFFYGAYVEGWALYAEQLAVEMGAYDDPYLRYGQLTSEMWRAIRLVVDTGMHAMDWTEQQAVDYFAANATTPLPTIRSEIRRYLVWPGQATSYKTGMLKILELRERAMDQLGDAFDIREFHDVVLGGGALPLAILEKRVDNWLQQR